MVRRPARHHGPGKARREAAGRDRFRRSTEVRGTLTVSAADGTAQVITVTISGTNDAVEIRGKFAGEVA
jgi:VCBS repeat-containing protein